MLAISTEHEAPAEAAGIVLNSFLFYLVINQAQQLNLFLPMPPEEKSRDHQTD